MGGYSIVKSIVYYMPRCTTKCLPALAVRRPLVVYLRQIQNHACMRSRFAFHCERSADDGHHSAVQRQTLTALLRLRIHFTDRTNADAIILDNNPEPVRPVHYHV
jgi:hypothetical protein